MEREQPYLNPKLKLADASAAIKYPQAKISQVLNQNLKTNFTDFINKYRVNEFKKRAQSDSNHQYTLTALSEMCGFNSRSSFFHVFKKITDQTPLEFLKESKIG
jgi:AraC-like DNA-binding protein